MKAERRHELQHNEVADWLAAAIERVKPYSRAIVAVAVAGTVLLIAYVVLSGRAEKKQSVAWTDYYQAIQADAKNVATDLESVVREHEGVPAGLWAEVALADLKLGEGIDSLFRDKQAAQTKLRSAVQHYEEVLGAADDPLLTARARFGLARALESQGQLDEARKVYDEIVKTSGTNAYVSVARQRLSDLERSSTRDFYAWFGKQEPVAPPPASELPGTPGERLPFEAGSIGTPGGLNLSGDNILDIPQLDKETAGPLLPPATKASDKDGQDATVDASKNEPDKDETKDEGKVDAGKEASKGDAAQKEIQDDKQDAKQVSKSDKDATTDGEKSSAKDAGDVKDDKAGK